MRFTVRLGPWSAEGVTTVRHREPGKELEPEASFEALGTARIFLQSGRGARRPWSSATSTP
ncbi:hypothetical protein [Streptomyces sp. XY332]|uniref:hypothetical protein n=1 Tax=Streptomyces sp. XY332 TaxID=1415561 RepID=UPI003B642221